MAGPNRAERRKALQEAFRHKREDTQQAMQLAKRATDVSGTPKQKSPGREYTWDIGVLVVSMVLPMTIAELPPTVYWVCVVGTYVSSALLAYHVWQHTQRVLFRIIGVLLVAAFDLFWSMQIIFVPTPFSIYSNAEIGNYPAHYNVGGIEWDPDLFVDVRLNLKNDSDIDLKDFQVMINTDLMLFDAVQTSNLPNVNLIIESHQNSPFSQAEAVTSYKDGRLGIIPLAGPGTQYNNTEGVRLLIDKFPRHTEVDLVIVAMNVGGAQLYGPKRLPTWMKIEGDFRLYGRTRDFRFARRF